MSIPPYQKFMLPLLRVLADGQVRTMREASDLVLAHFHLGDADLNAFLPSGQQTIVNNRIGWAKTYLKKAALLNNPNRGRVQITDAGRELLSTNPAEITPEMLRSYPSFQEFVESAGSEERSSPQVSTASERVQSTPTEMLASAYATLRQTTKDDLLARLRTCSPAFFERAVLKLLQGLGYGLSGDGEVTGGPGDGGIDGVIREDKLGLDIVCIQAKRWTGNPVGRATVQEFVGSMDYVRAKKGVIITTSTFTKDATSFVDRIEAKKVVLIDGERLCDLMLDHNVGVTTTDTYHVKEVSNDFFDEEAQ